MGYLRTKESQEYYQAHVAAGGLADGCRLCEAPSLKEFELWRIIGNNFPYDKIAKTHHMIIPKRHANDREITEAEWQEFKTIKEAYLHPTYEYLVEPTWKMKSIPAHMHLHLLVAKD